MDRYTKDMFWDLFLLMAATTIVVVWIMFILLGFYWVMSRID